MKLKTQIIISSLLLVVSLFALLDTVLMFSFGRLFMSAVEIRNSSDETVRITPYGNGSHGYIKLDTYFNAYPVPISSWKQSDYELEAEESKVILYDSDDTYAAGFVVATVEGKYLDMPATYEDGKDYFEITNLSALPVASPDLIALAQNGIFWWLVFLNAIILIGLLNIPYFLYLLRKKLKRTVS